jgi:hypothetical protein
LWMRAIQLRSGNETGDYDRDPSSSAWFHFAGIGLRARRRIQADITSKRFMEAGCFVACWRSIRSGVSRSNA